MVVGEKCDVVVVAVVVVVVGVRTTNTRCH